MVRINRYMQEHAPERSLEHWVAPKSDTQPINSRLEELLRTAKPSNWNVIGENFQFTKEELEVAEKFWRDREEERRLERRSEL